MNICNKGLPKFGQMPDRLLVSTELMELNVTEMDSGFGGLEVACWLLVPKFAGSNPAEAVRFLRGK